MAKRRLSVEVLVLSHEAATTQETEPYLQTRLAPLRPLILFGRTASRHPPCHKQECVYYGWRDRLVKRASGLCGAGTRHVPKGRGEWILKFV
jgi:hypothetical protein